MLLLNLRLFSKFPCKYQNTLPANGVKSLDLHYAMNKFLLHNILNTLNYLEQVVTSFFQILLA